MRAFAHSLVVAVLLVSATGSIRAQFLETHTTPTLPTNAILKNFLFTNIVGAPKQKINWGESQTPVEANPKPKNGLLAAGLSLLIPGLGEYYVGDQIWRGAIFTAIEGGLWYGRYHFNRQGDASQNSFHAWGDSLWIPSHYANYLDSLMTVEGRPSLIRDRNNISQLNNESDTLNALGFPGLAHQLPQQGSEEFYQVIAEYVQFSPGWADNGSQSNSNSKDFQRYADLDAASSHQYEIANDFLYGIIINHILSAIDAALCAKDHNTPIRLHGELHQMNYPDGTIGYQPTAAIEVKF